MGNIVLTRKRDLSSFRMIAIGTWRTTKDPSVYGALELPMDAAMDYLEAFREQTGRRLTVTHLIAKAVGKVLADMPDANAILRFNRIYMREDVDLFFQVAMKDPVSGQIDLSGVTLRKVDKKPLLEIVDEFERVAAKVRAGKDKEKEQTRQTFKRLPGWFVGPLLDLISFLTYTLNLNLSWAGLPKDPFGSAMITNVGSLGLEEAYVPLVPYSKVPLLLALGAIRRVPVVLDDDSIGVARIMKVFATFDHRILDGAHASQMATTLKEVFSNPAEHFGALDTPPVAEVPPQRDVAAPTTQ